jgi:hypothetical protein
MARAGMPGKETNEAEESNNQFSKGIEIRQFYDKAMKSDKKNSHWDSVYGETETENQQPTDPDQAEKDVAKQHGDVDLHYAKHNGSLPTDLTELEKEIGNFLDAVNRNGGINGGMINIELPSKFDYYIPDNNDATKKLKDTYKGYVDNGANGKQDPLTKFLNNEISTARKGGARNILGLPNITSAVNSYYIIKTILNKKGVNDAYIKIRWTHDQKSSNATKSSISYKKLIV